MSQLLLHREYLQYLGGEISSCQLLAQKRNALGVKGVEIRDNSDLRALLVIG